MPPVRPPHPSAPLGLILRPIAPGAASSDSGNTVGRTHEGARGSTTGTTHWLRDVCRRAEAAGAGALWATDHLFWGQPTLECMTTLAVAATVTERVTVGSCVLQLPLRTPASVAKEASALQALSEGRFVLGVGVGSHPGEYEAAGCDFHRRGADLDQGIAALRRAWSTAGEAEAAYRMEPAAPAPIWVGGSSRAARRRAARSGDGWIPLFVTPAQLAEDVVRLAEETCDAGRDPSAVTPAVVMVASVGEDPDKATASGLAWLSALYGIPAKAFQRHLVAGPPELCAEMAERYLEAGARHVAVMVAGDDPVGPFGELAAAFGLRRSDYGPLGPEMAAATDDQRSGAALAGVGA